MKTHLLALVGTLTLVGACGPTAPHGDLAGVEDTDVVDEPAEDPVPGSDDDPDSQMPDAATRSSWAARMAPRLGSADSRAEPAS
jgi:hypothetical protein